MQGRPGGGRRRARRYGIVFWALMGVSPQLLADVYVSSAGDGSVSYASQALDSSYVLLWRAPQDPQVVPSEPPAPVPPTARAHGPREARRQALRPLAASAARIHQVPEALVMAVIETESDFRTDAVSAAGARGLMQLMPATGRQYGLLHPRHFHDPARNIDAGVRYLRDLLRRAGDNTALALAMYNAGGGNVARHGERIPPFRETMIYVPTVLGRAAAYPSSFQGVRP